MKSKIKNFSFTFQLQRNVPDLSRRNGYRIEGIDLLVEGVGYEHNDHSERYSADLESISYDGGNNILPVIELTDTIEEIHTAACQHVAGLFEFEWQQRMLEDEDRVNALEMMAEMKGGRI